MFKKEKMITVAVVGMAMLMLAGGASAIMTADDLEAKKAERDAKKADIQADREAKKEEIEAKKEDRATQRCEQIKEKTRSRIEKFEGNNKYHQKNFNLIKQNIEEIVALFKEAGLNTANLESYLTILETKLAKLYADHAAFIVALEASEGVSCDNIESEIKGKFKIAKQEGEDIKADIIDVKNYYKDTIRPELISLKKEYLEATGIDSEEGDDASESEEEKIETPAE